MTDQELKDLVASLAVNSAKTDAQLAKTDAQLAKSDALFTKYKEENRIGFEKSRLSFEKYKEENRIGFAELRQKQETTFKKLEIIGRQLADIGFSNGDAAEDFFYNSLEEKKQLGKIEFDEIFKNMHMKRKRTEDEFDILLENGNCVGIVEVKYKVKKEHIEKMFTQKAPNFRILFPDFEGYKLYMGIAGLSFEPGVQNYAIEQGLVVLKQKGEALQVYGDNMMAF